MSSNPPSDSVAPHSDNAQYLSPDGAKTPPRISSQSLVGEGIVSSTRRLSSEQADAALSPFTPSEATTTPPISRELSIPLSPPPLNTSNAETSQHEILQSTLSVTSSLKQAGPGSTRPPRIPQVSVPPTRGSEHRHGRVPSNTDYSFLSALTDSSSECSLSKRRTLSWDMNDPDRKMASSPSATHRSTPASILQPILFDDTSEAVVPPASIFASNVNSFRSEELKGGRALQNATKMNECGQTLATETLSDAFGQDGDSPMRTSNHGIDTSFHDASYHTPPKNQNLPPKRYSVNEVLDATPKEGQDIAEIVKKLENQSERASVKAKHRHLPLMSDSRIQRFHDSQEDENTNDRCFEKINSKSNKNCGQPSTIDIIVELTKQLVEVPPMEETRRSLAGDTTNLFSNESSTQSKKKNDIERGGKQMKDESVTRQDKDFMLIQKRRFCVPRKMRGDLDCFVDFVRPQVGTIKAQFRRSLKYLILPSLVAATFLYYVFGNPRYNQSLKEDGASVSWWFLFIGVRQIITLELAKLLEIVCIDFLTLRTKAIPRLLGPTLSLTLTQSKGWPFQLFAWGMIDLIVLWGERPFVRHWGYWQDFIAMMNKSNPSGSIIFSPFYFRILISSLVLSAMATVKRAILEHTFGKRIVVNHRCELAMLMRKLILLKEVGYLSTRLQIDSQTAITNRVQSFPSLDEAYEKAKDLLERQIETEDSFDYSEPRSVESKESFPVERSKPSYSSVQIEMAEMLEEWEEPELLEGDEEDVDMYALLRFRRALTLISNEYPFSPAFGSARTREECVQSSQKVFERLTSNSLQEKLDIDTISQAARKEDGTVDKAKVKELIRLFRPSRSGKLNKLEFVKSVDSVYKTLCFLLAKIHSHSQIDQACEAIVNNAFYTALFFVLLAMMGVGTVALIVGISGLLVSLAFIIGTVGSKYIDGILFVLVRRPYDIGDRIEISNALNSKEEDTIEGTRAIWVVEKVDLYTTTMRSGTTREVASFANGSLASSTIVNMKRSEKPNIYLYFKFGLEVSSEQVKAFRTRISSYVKDRPREWIRLVSFRCNKVEATLGFVEYVLVAQHREAWQNLPAILESKSNIFASGLEIQKALTIEYKAPHVPMDTLRSSIIPGITQIESPPHSSTDYFEGKKDR